MNAKTALGLGFITGLVLPLVALFLLFQLRPELLGIQKFDYQVVRNLNAQILSLGLLLNGAVFFLAIKLDKEEFSRGILAASVLAMIAVFIYRFLL